MLSELTLCPNHARRTSGLKTVRFEKGINVLVGPNGSGKSTILKAIDSCSECRKEFHTETSFHYFDCTTMNPANPNSPVRSAKDFVLRIRSLFSSHGEIMKAALTSLPVRKGDCLLIDEPEAGQDLEGILRLREGFAAVCAAGGQVVVASHHPVFWRDVNLIELVPGYAASTREKYREFLG